MKETKTIIVIPCYNEEKRLSIDAFLNFAIQHQYISFIFVNDGSNDGTKSIINTLCKAQPKTISAIHLENNVGKAEAVRTGFLKSFKKNPHYIGFWDADLSAPLSEISRFTSLMNSNSSIEAILGARVKLMGKDIKRKRGRHYIGRFFATLFSYILKFPVYDTQCGAKLFRYSKKLDRVFSEPFLTRWLFDVEILARLVAFSESTAMPDVYIFEEPLLKWHHVNNSKISVNNVFQIMAEIVTLWKDYR